MARNAKETPKTGLAKRDKRMLGVIAVSALLTFFVGLGLAGYAAINYKYERAQEGSDEQFVFNVPRGAGLSSISQSLEKEGFIKSAFVFKLSLIHI